MHTIQPIQKHQNTISKLKNNTLIHEILHSLLSNIYDIEQLKNQIITKITSPQNLTNLQHSLKNLNTLQSKITKLNTSHLKQLTKHLNPLNNIHEQLITTLTNDPTQSTTKKQLIHNKFDNKLDKFVHLSHSKKK